MRLNKTIKRRLGHLRRTAKRYLNSGGARGRPLNPRAEPFKYPSPTAVSPSRAASPPRSVLPPVNNAAIRAAEKQIIIAARDAYFENLLGLKQSNFPGIDTIIGNAYALDCEMVGVGPEKYDDRGRPYRDSTLAHVVIVDFKGKKRLDKYVIPKEGLDAVTDFRTDISGITKEKLERLNPDSHSYEKVVSLVQRLLNNKIIVGHGLQSDFKVLDNFKPPVPIVVWDTATIDKYMKNVPGYGRGARRLVEITKEFANNNIQVPGRSHNPLEDAKASMNLYRIYFGYPKFAL
jgi:hypothetical protein